MKKIIVFGSKFWPDCDPVKEFLSQNNIKHAYLDISEGMFNLKSFLKYRDNRKEFEEIKAKGQIGLPCIVVNGGEKIFFELPELSELQD